MYHAIEDAPRPPREKHLYVQTKAFAFQMRALKKAGYQAVTFDALGDALHGETPLPPRPVLLTFDDGYADLERHAHPVLRECGFAYTVFLVTGKMGTINDWDTHKGYAPAPLLSWDAAKRLAQEGASLQPHTETHPRLADLPIEDAREEMARSKDAVEQQTGSPADVLCYPYGSVSEAVADAARALGFRMAVTTQTGRVRFGDDLLRLPRLSVHHVPTLSLTYGIGALNFWWRVRLWKDARPEP